VKRNSLLSTDSARRDVVPKTNDLEYTNTSRFRKACIRFVVRRKQTGDKERTGWMD
jgi:hypothetical protein